MKIVISFLILTAMTVTSAEEKSPTNESEMELGIGLGALSLPHYRGSSQRSDYNSFIPYLRYNGDHLKIDREGGRYNFYDDSSIRIDLSMAFSLAVDSSDNIARKGMSDLGHIIEFGPRVQFKLYQSQDNNIRIRFALPLRTAYATDFNHTENIGWVFSPYLQFRYFKTGWESAFSIGPVWSTEQYHDYFYEVTPQHSTVTRASYNAKAGYSGSRLTVTVSKRFDKVFFGLFAKYDNLNDAVFIDSPLIKQNDSFILGVALSWILNK